MSDRKSQESNSHVTVGNVTYLWGRTLQKAGPAYSEEAGSEESNPDQWTGFTLEEMTAVRRLEASLSGAWTPARLKTKIKALGFSGDKAERVFRHILENDSYDTLWVATREVGRRLKRGKGEHLLQAELRAAGFDDDVIRQALQAVSEEDWQEALSVAMQSSRIRSKEGPALKQALARRGFSSSRIQAYLKGLQENV